MRKNRIVKLLQVSTIILAVVVFLTSYSVAFAQDTFTVTTTADNGDNNNPIDGSLRWALRQAYFGNANIVFNIPTSDPGYNAPSGGRTTGWWTITYDGSETSIRSLYGDGVHIDGDVDDDGIPDIELDGSNLANASTSYGIRIYSDDNTIEGLIIHSFGGSGIVLGENYNDPTRGVENNTIRNCYIGIDASATQLKGIGDGVEDAEGEGSNEGIYFLAGSSNNTVENCIIGGAARAAIWLTGFPGDDHSANGNTIRNNYLGTNAAGDDLGNTQNGIVIQKGASNNRIEGNTIRFNGFNGIQLGNMRQFAPNTTGRATQGNEIVDNVITDNKGQGMDPNSMGNRGGIMCYLTHDPVHRTPTTGDNLFQGNTISGNTGAGIFNLGCSPRVVNNDIISNTRYGIVNLVDYGTVAAQTIQWVGPISTTIDLTCASVTDGPTCYDPMAASPTTVYSSTEHPYSYDVTSVPTITNNTIDSNCGDCPLGKKAGVLSLDTAPANKDTLSADNDIGNNDGEYDIVQDWRGAVEVLFTNPTVHPPTYTIEVRILSAHDNGLLHNGSVRARAESESEEWYIWAENPANETLNYDNVETWFRVREYEVSVDGDLTNHSPHTITAYIHGVTMTAPAATFSFDGIETSHPVSPDYGLLYYRADADGQERYQIAQIAYDPYASDSDDDGIPDIIEGGDDLDGDGIPDYRDTDADGDGIPDIDEGTDDLDGDGIPDYRDTDADGDGIPDIDEGTDDLDGDGLPNYKDTDSDGDGISDQNEGSTDADDDGIPNFLDGDSDGDGIPDAFEGTDDPDGDGTSNPTDVDDDGTPNFLDDDADGDGITDALESNLDIDSNDTIDDNPDDAGDGDVDMYDCPYTSTHELYDLCAVDDEGDSDDDGILDWLDLDIGNDGTLDCDEDPLDPIRADEDCDGIPNPLDVDADGDDTSDDCQTDPAPPIVHAPDPDCDGIANYLDEDSDGDGLPDSDEYYTGTEDEAFCSNTEFDQDDDGTPSCIDNDADGDGIPNYLDPDTDDDGLLDSTTQPTDSPEDDEHDIDNDDVWNYLDPIYRILMPIIMKTYDSAS